MKAIHINLPPNAKFHFGEYVEDQNTALYNTSTIIHSDVLFGAFISALSQVNEEKIEDFKKYFEEGKLSFSSAFYRVELKDKNPVYLLPKPVSLNLFQAKDLATFELKKFKKIEFISKGVWEKGISPEHWFDKNAECVMPNSKTVCLRTEIGNEEFELYTVTDEVKVGLRTKSEENELYTLKAIELSSTSSHGIGFYFLLESNIPNEDEELMQKVWQLVAINGIGGERSTGCGVVMSMEQENFHINVDKESENKVLLGLAFPKTLENYLYYQTKMRGGMNYGAGKRLKVLTAIQEGAIINGEIKPRIVDMGEKEKPYWKYSSNLQLPLHENYNLE